MTPIIISIIIGLAIGIALGLLLAKDKSREAINKIGLELASEKSRFEQVKNNLEMLKFETDQIRESNNLLIQKNATLEENARNLNIKIAGQKEEVEKMHILWKEEFSNMATNIVRTQSNDLQEKHKETLKLVLDPLKENIIKFEKKVEDTHNKSTEQTASLKEQINALSELNKTIGTEAKNLTKALKGESKTRGNWGENLLLTILEKSGLQKGIGYDVQQSINTDEGRRLIPDVIINLPDDKKLIIDSKISLVDYEKYVEEETEELRKIHLLNHIRSIKRHIDELSGKNYQNLYGINTPDFVLLFMPIEPAFHVALHQDPDLYTNGFEKNIIIITNSTLLATLKTVAHIWNQEKLNRNSAEIARQAGDLYDKFVNFSTDLMQVGKKMDEAKGVYSDAMKKLVEGKDNLVRKTQRLKELGAKSSKEIDMKLLDRSED